MAAPRDVEFENVMDTDKVELHDAQEQGNERFMSFRSLRLVQDLSKEKN